MQERKTNGDSDTTEGVLPGPDTDRMDPPSQIPSTRSVDRKLDVESSKQFASKVAETKASLLAQEVQDTVAAQDTAVEASKEQSRFSTISGGADASRVTGHGSQAEKAGNNHTTLQSMKRPELIAGGIPHSRRFLSIERELEQCSATLKLLEKGLNRTQKEARIAWITAACALLLALSALTL